MNFEKDESGYSFPFAPRNKIKSKKSQKEFELKLKNDNIIGRLEIENLEEDWLFLQENGEFDYYCPQNAVHEIYVQYHEEIESIIRHRTSGEYSFKGIKITINEGDSNE